jgi:hypothetical protein
LASNNRQTELYNQLDEQRLDQSFNQLKSALLDMKRPEPAPDDLSEPQRGRGHPMKWKSNRDCKAASRIRRKIQYWCNDTLLKHFMHTDVVISTRLVLDQLPTSQLPPPPSYYEHSPVTIGILPIQSDTGKVIINISIANPGFIGIFATEDIEEKSFITKCELPKRIGIPDQCGGFGSLAAKVKEGFFNAEFGSLSLFAQKKIEKGREVIALDK